MGQVPPAAAARRRAAHHGPARAGGLPERGGRRAGLLARLAPGPAPQRPVPGNPDDKYIWIKIWDDCGYEIISDTDEMPDFSAAVEAIGQQRGRMAARTISGRPAAADASQADGGELLPTAHYAEHGIPLGIQEDRSYRLGDLPGADLLQQLRRQVGRHVPRLLVDGVEDPQLLLVRHGGDDHRDLVVRCW